MKKEGEGESIHSTATCPQASAAILEAASAQGGLPEVSRCVYEKRYLPEKGTLGLAWPTMPDGSHSIHLLLAEGSHILAGYIACTQK